MSLYNWPHLLTEGTFGAADYNPLSDQYTFLPGQTRVCVGITILSDNIFEQDETFSGRITGIQLPGEEVQAMVPGISVIQDQTVVTITDQDGE